MILTKNIIYVKIMSNKDYEWRESMSGANLKLKHELSHGSRVKGSCLGTFLYIIRN